MKGEAKQTTTVLVTDGERTNQLLDILGERFSHHGELHVPTLEQYEALGNDEGLAALTIDLCRWLGFKPKKLRVCYGNTPSTTHSDVSDDTIIISNLLRDHPLAVGGMIALATIELVSLHHALKIDERFTEVGTIESGLALWVINAIDPHVSRFEKLYHLIDGAWHRLDGLQLKSMSIGEYLQQFSIYTSQNHLFPESYIRGVSRRSIHLLPPTPNSVNIPPMPQPTIMFNHQHNAKIMLMRISLLSLIAACIFTCAITLWNGRSQPIPEQQIRDTESLRVIKQSLSECIYKASEQQSTYDPNDLFMTRQIDATKARCESLRNQYNDALSQYQTNYP